MKFYPQDWRADIGLRMCSFAARGLWADMIGLMHHSSRPGFLLVGNVSPSPQQLAALLGSAEEEVAQLLKQLETANVFSITGQDLPEDIAALVPVDMPNGVVLCRRMLRDEAKAVKDKTNGKRGGNPQLVGPVKEGVNPPDKAQRPEARDQTPDRESRAADAAIARKVGSRLSPDWMPTEADREYAAKIGLGLSVAMIADKFRDHWLAATGSKAVKRDWAAAWRTWCRNEIEFASRRLGGATPPPGSRPKFN